MAYISSIDGSYYEGDKQYGDIDVPKRPSPNHIWQGGEWVLVLTMAKSTQIKYINAEADKAFAQILAPYPAHEVSTWPNQYAEAWALQSDPAAYTPTLAGIALVSGETVAVLATAVLAKAAAYTNVSGQIVGKRKLKTAQIESCVTNAEVEAITW